MLTYNNSGFSPVSIQVESAANNGGSPGSYSAGFPNGTVVTGTNPLTSTTAGFVVIQGYNAWVQVNLSTATGSGVIPGALYGWKVPSAAAGPGTGGLDQLTQDVLAGPGSGSQPATVVGINTVPLCAGFSPTNGQVLQYTTGLSPNPCYTAASGGPPTGAAGGDLSGSYPDPSVVALDSVPFCSGYSPTNGQSVEYTTGGSPNPCYAASNLNLRAIGASFNGGGLALTAGKTVYFTVPYACTIAAWNIAVDTGTATIDVWKIATGTAIPTVTNTITAAALPAISTGTAIHSTTLTGWTTSVAQNDIFGINLEAVSGATYANLILQCNQ